MPTVIGTSNNDFFAIVDSDDIFGTSNNVINGGDSNDNLALNEVDITSTTVATFNNNLLSDTDGKDQILV